MHICAHTASLTSLLSVFLVLMPVALQMLEGTSSPRESRFLQMSYDLLGATLQMSTKGPGAHHCPNRLVFWAFRVLLSSSHRDQEWDNWREYLAPNWLTSSVLTNPKPTAFAGRARQGSLPSVPLSSCLQTDTVFSLSRPLLWPGSRHPFLLDLVTSQLQ